MKQSDVEAKIMKNVLQRCHYPFNQFHLYVQEAINKRRASCQIGIKIHGEKIDVITFADD